MIKFQIYDAVLQLPTAWNDLSTHDIFLNTAYLKGLEKGAPETLTLYYIGVFKDDLLVGIAVIQRVKLYAKDIFRSEFSSKLTYALKDLVSRSLKGNILVIGNLTHTGQHGFYFNSALISQHEFLNVLFKGIGALTSLIKKQENKSIRAILFKDYFKNDKVHGTSSLFFENQFYKLNVQPNMILVIDERWKAMSDYVGDLTKKYKTRCNRARRKFGDIKMLELSEPDLRMHMERMYQLYTNVSNNASFNTFILPKDHFLTLKVALKHQFKIFGYFKNDALVGFFTLILNYDTLETYFLGYDDQHQTQHQLYLNMLYDMIGFGIKNNFGSIVFARTAMEIKSSVGAVPEPMSIYIKHTNVLINASLKLIFKVMNPEQIWIERHPFKTVEKS